MFSKLASVLRRSGEPCSVSASVCDTRLKMADSSLLLQRASSNRVMSRIVFLLLFEAPTAGAFHARGSAARP